MSKALDQLNNTIENLKYIQESLQEETQRQETESVFFQKTERVLHGFLQDRLTPEDFDRARHLIAVLVQES